MADATEQRSAQERLARIQFEDKPEGPIAAAVIAGGIGAAALGVLTTLAEASEGVREWLQLLVWLVAWAVLHAALRRRPYETRRALVVALVLIAVGVVGTFPTFFQLFAE